MLHGIETLQAVQAVQVAERIQAQLAGCHYPSLPAHVRLTVSCGIATLNHTRHLHHALQQADGRSYAAKSSGRNCVRWMDPLPDAASAKEGVRALGLNSESAQAHFERG